MFHQLRCKVCEKVFCCVDHRRQHERKSHKSELMSSGSRWVQINRKLKFHEQLFPPTLPTVKENRDLKTSGSTNLLGKRKLTSLTENKFVMPSAMCNSRNARRILVPVYRFKRIQKVPKLHSVKEEIVDETSFEHDEKENQSPPELLQKATDLSSSVKNEVLDNTKGEAVSPNAEVVQPDNISDISEISLCPNNLIVNMTSPLLDNVFTTSTPTTEEVDNHTMESEEGLFVTPATHFNLTTGCSPLPPFQGSKSFAIVSPVMASSSMDSTTTTSMKRKVSFADKLEYVYQFDRDSTNEEVLRKESETIKRAPVLGILSSVTSVLRNAFERLPGKEYWFNSSENGNCEQSWAVPCSPSGRKKIRTITPAYPKIRGRPTYQRNPWTMERGSYLKKP